ncbi:ParB/RepB/Spo0J family partition protein [Phycicoccus sp. HDW14]|uniref:ParB/RepB/Spo0J family partition protein n=1 Tax=Phycicoccus sp. HDW14 TaxID=2714941 RepID=UPI00140B1559|nr:ParB/RepB/Spo0J family partition protein [Phycicoccus sp. HDW14]QIM19900.1 ParB/RepB/Spo0J family partition protein [Phycicoccus sp. HDW14]
MTATATTPTAQTRLEHVALSQVKAHPDNVRLDVGDVTDLAASVESVGLLEPLVVAPPHTGMTARSMGKATWLLIAGHRRLAAAKKAKLTTVPVLIREDLTTRGAQIEAMLVENLQRVDLTPVEEADAYQLLLDIDGLTQKALAAKVGQPATRIRDRLKLAKIGEAARSALQAHQVTIEQALEISEFDDDPKAQKTLLKAVGSNNYTFTLNSARREREEAAALAVRLEKLSEAGVTVLANQPKGSKHLEDLLPNFPRTWGTTARSTPPSSGRTRTAPAGPPTG